MRVVILSGGSGSRLWPLSNAVQSKQFLQVLSGPDGQKESMLQRVCRQLDEAGIADDRICVVAGSEQADYIRAQVGPKSILIEEPARRNTFPAIALSVLHLSEIQGADLSEPVIVMPADVYTEQGYFDTLRKMAQLCEEDLSSLILMGIRPKSASDQFGYMVPEDGDSQILKVNHFVEKPPVQEAEKLIQNGALWNGGVFAFRLGWMLERVRASAGDVSYGELSRQYDLLEKTSFDYAVVEKVSDIAAVPYDGEWMDLGTWGSLSSRMEDTVFGNTICVRGCGGTTVINELPLPMAVIGIKDSVVCATWDGILVADKKESVHLKDDVDVSMLRPMYEQRRWGDYSVLESMDAGDGRKSLTKHLVIANGKALSYQKHQHRDEIWTILAGTGEVTVGERTMRVKAGDVVKIPAGTLHCARGICGLHIVEVQIGEELEEKDIERVEEGMDSSGNSIASQTEES